MTGKSSNSFISEFIKFLNGFQWVVHPKFRSFKYQKKKRQQTDTKRKIEGK